MPNTYNLLTELEKAKDVFNKKAELTVADQYELNYLSVAIERVKNVISSQEIFPNPEACTGILHELNNKAKRTLKHNTQIGTYRGAMTVKKITDMLLISNGVRV